MKEIINKCKCGVFFTANEHKNYYETAEKWLLDQINDQSEIDDIGKDVWEEMIKRDTVYILQFYLATPIGFYKIFHYDYDKLIKEAKKILETL